jgi:hypothetical protein
LLIHIEVNQLFRLFSSKFSEKTAEKRSKFLFPSFLVACQRNNSRSWGFFLNLSDKPRTSHTLVFSLKTIREYMAQDMLSAPSIQEL